jgi:molecular chaperone GrpE (heat shock protein)
MKTLEEQHELLKKQFSKLAQEKEHYFLVSQGLVKALNKMSAEFDIEKKTKALPTLALEDRIACLEIWYQERKCRVLRLEAEIEELEKENEQYKLMVQSN